MKVDYKNLNYLYMINMVTKNTCNYYLTKLKRNCKLFPYSQYTFCHHHIHCEKPMQYLDKPDECPVCLDELDQTDLPLKCGHYVHRDCIIKSGKTKCPICRFDIYLTLSELKKCKSYRLQYHRDESLVNVLNANIRVDNNLSNYNICQHVRDVGIENILNLSNHNIRQHIRDVGIENILNIPNIPNLSSLSNHDILNLISRFYNYILHSQLYNL